MCDEGEFKACVVLPQLQDIICSLNKPCEIIGDIRDRLIILRDRFNILLYNAEVNKYPALEEDKIAAFYLPNDFKNAKTLR